MGERKKITLGFEYSFAALHGRMKQLYNLLICQLFDIFLNTSVLAQFSYS